MWNNSYWKLTGDTQKDCYINKAIRIHREAGKKGKEEMTGICAPARGLREKVITEAKILGCPRPGVQQSGKTSPFPGWRTAGTNRRAVGSWTLASGGAWGILAPEAGRRKQTGFLWSPRHEPSLSWESTAALCLRPQPRTGVWAAIIEAKAPAGDATANKILHSFC